MKWLKCDWKTKQILRQIRMKKNNFPQLERCSLYACILESLFPLRLSFCESLSMNLEVIDNHLCFSYSQQV